MFPTLTSAQIARIAFHGVTRSVTRGEVLIDGGQLDVPFFVVRAGDRHVFLMTGAEAGTGWLNGRVTLDKKGFNKTGPDLTPQELAAQWPLERTPYLLDVASRRVRRGRCSVREHQARGIGC